MKTHRFAKLGTCGKCSKDAFNKYEFLFIKFHEILALSRFNDHAKTKRNNLNIKDFQRIETSLKINANYCLSFFFYNIYIFHSGN